MPFGDELFRLGLRTTGVFFIKLAAGLNRTPVRGYIFLTPGDVLFGCPSRYADKDAGGYRSAEAGVVPFSHHLAYLMNRDQPALRNAFHGGVHLQR